MSIHRLSRRRVVAGSAACLAALGLGAGLAWPATALADTKKRTPLKGAPLAQVEAKYPQGSETALDARLNPHADRLAQLLLHKTRHAMALAAANPSTTFAPDSLHAVAAAHIARLPPKRAQRAKARAAAMLASPAKAATFGPYAKGDVASAQVKQATDVELSSAIRSMTTALKDSQKAAEKQGDKDKDQPVFTRIMLQLNSVKCIKEQDSTSASDELLISGSLIERDGNIVKIDRIKYEDFDEGETRYLDYEMCNAFAGNPGMIGLYDTLGQCPHGSADDVYRGRKLAESRLGGPGTWGLVLVLGEQDDGGFNSMMSDIYKKLKTEVDALMQQVFNAAGEAVGAALSAYLGPLGEAIGVALAWALGKLFEWFMSLLDNKDDLIAAKTWSVQLEHRTQSYVKSLASDNLPSPKGTWASPMKKWTFKGEGGHYEVRLHWRAYA
jgi:hypothetical protein